MFEEIDPPKPITRPQDSPDWKGVEGNAPSLPPQGLGDQVEKIAQPIARAIDRVAGTNIRNCGGCQKRKKWLNKKFPGDPKT